MTLLTVHALFSIYPSETFSTVFQWSRRLGYVGRLIYCSND